MKKIILWIGVATGIILYGLSILGWSWIRQFQALADEEPNIVLSPDVADITYCKMDGVPLKMACIFRRMFRLRFRYWSTYTAEASPGAINVKAAGSSIFPS